MHRSPTVCTTTNSAMSREKWGTVVCDPGRERSMFVDQVEIEVQAGSGGNGAVTFRKEKFVPHGGPSGGDGGRGGSVVLEVDPHLSTLLDFRYQRHYKAQRGGDGQSKDMYGKDGADLILK